VQGFAAHVGCAATGVREEAVHTSDAHKAAQVTSTKAFPVTHADVNALAVNPAWHAIVQACPSAILLIPGPHGSAPLVPAPLATVVTAQPGGVLTSQVTGFKVVVPVGQLAVVALGVYPP